MAISRLALSDMALCQRAAVQGLRQRLIGLGMQGFDDVTKTVCAIALTTQVVEFMLKRLQLC
jgi:hypothetical protein